MWRNVVREYSEELLGEPERDGSSGAILDYDAWPLFRLLQDARESGRLAVHCLGVTIDPLTLGATILTTAVFDDDVFDEAFGAAVRVNAEGVLISAAGTTRVTDGLPFDESTVTRLLRDEPMAPSSASTLDRAWTFRDALLGHA
jgi:hypothetical protein